MSNLSEPNTISSPSSIWASTLQYYVQPVLLPLLITIFPSLFHYGNNAGIVILPSLLRMLLLFSLIGLGLYVFCVIFLRREPYKAAIAASVLLVFFNTYGLVFNFVKDQDLLRVTDYRLLPPYILLAIYISWLLVKRNPKTIWSSFSFLFGILVIFNLVKIIPPEYQKYIRTHPLKSTLAQKISGISSMDKPDIYFIIFDEMAGFDTMRNYWKYSDVDIFKKYLQSKGFVVIENSKSGTIDTLQIMSERFNYKDYPLGAEYRDTYYDAISNSIVMQYFKSIGYTTIVFDETKFGYPAIPSIKADISYEFASSKIKQTGFDTGILFDEFAILVSENTMFRAFPMISDSTLDPTIKQHQDMVFFTTEKIGNLKEINGPKFIHVHLMLTHFPFIFTETGSLNDSNNFFNWNYYLGTYKFGIKTAMKMIDGILAEADPARPPIIIFQSDHGARNKVVQGRNGIPLVDFPEDYKHHIVNALLLPGYDTSTIPQDMAPINTFPIILNHYFKFSIPLK